MNEPTGLGGLLQSRRFITLMVDALLSIVLYFVGKYFSIALDDVKFLILILQPIALLVIAAYTVNDLAAQWSTHLLEVHEATLKSQATTSIALARLSQP